MSIYSVAIHLLEDDETSILNRDLGWLAYPSPGQGTRKKISQFTTKAQRHEEKKQNQYAQARNSPLRPVRHLDPADPEGVDPLGPSKAESFSLDRYRGFIPQGRTWSLDIFRVGARLGTAGRHGFVSGHGL
jgi:hypothetical protein